jgi:hypothetical protein
MFTEPQSVTIGADTSSLPRVAFGTNSGTFQKDDASVKLTVSHAYQGKRTRRVIRLDSAKIVADPLIEDLNVESTIGVYLVVDEPKNGFSQAEKLDVVKALTTLLTASSAAATVKFLGGES